MKNKIILHNKKIIAYICLVHFLINVKNKKWNCKTESYFLIMSSMVGRGLRTHCFRLFFYKRAGHDLGFFSISAHMKSSSICTHLLWVRVACNMHLGLNMHQPSSQCCNEKRLWKKENRLGASCSFASQLKFDGLTLENVEKKNKTKKMFFFI